jgi:ketosteroid isomerase-like protein
MSKHLTSKPSPSIVRGAHNELEETSMPQATDALRELERTWTQAETRGDTDALEALTTPDFRLVGPAGFILNKQQWLDRYRQEQLVTGELRFEEPSTVLYGDTAVTIGRQVQRARFQGHPVDGEFRLTQITVHDDTGWRLAGMHLSPIGGPPPFLQQQGAPSGQARETGGAQP